MLHTQITRRMIIRLFMLINFYCGRGHAAKRQKRRQSCIMALAEWTCFDPENEMKAVYFT